MATLYTQQSKNVGRTWFLMAIFLVLIVGLGYVVSYTYGNPGILYIAIIFSMVMNIVSFWYSDKIILKISNAKEAKREEYMDLYNSVQNLSITAGLPMPKVYVIDDISPNAFATGRDKEHAIVAFTTGLIKILDKSELEGVVSHELSHIGNRDTLLATVVVILVGFIAILADLFIRSTFLGGNRGGRGNPIFQIIGIIFIILSPFIAKIIQLAISRKREFLADASGALLTRYPEGLASALKKISQTDMPMKKASNATAHLFIANPFGSKDKVKELFSTHPKVEDRVKALIGSSHI
jgi:heat shock protein HtpX